MDDWRFGKAIDEQHKAEGRQDREQEPIAVMAKLPNQPLAHIRKRRHQMDADHDHDADDEECHALGLLEPSTTVFIRASPLSMSPAIIFLPLNTRHIAFSRKLWWSVMVQVTAV